MEDSLFGLFWKIFKFGVVGVSCTFIDFGLTWFLKEKLRWNKYLSNAIGFAVSATVNYSLNRIWTFRNGDPNVGTQFATFFLLASIGLGLNFMFVYFFHNRFKLNFYLAKAMATGLVFIYNFLVNQFIVFG